MSDEGLYQKAIDAIQKLFSVTSIPVSETRANLNDLISEIEMLLDTLKEEE